MKSEDTRPRAFRPVGRGKKTSSSMMKKRLSERLRALKAAVVELQAKIMRDPRTKNVVGFAAVAVLAAVVFTFAAPGTEKASGPPAPGEFAYLRKRVPDPGGDRFKELSANARVKVIRHEGERTLVSTYREGDKWIPASNLSARPIREEDIEPEIPAPGQTRQGWWKGKPVTWNLGRSTHPVTRELMRRMVFPGERPDDPQGRTDELLAAMDKMVDAPLTEEGWGLVDNPSAAAYATVPTFSVLEEHLKTGTVAENNLPLLENRGGFSLRPEFEKRGVAVKSSPREDITCTPLAFQAALEFLWSEREKRPVKLSASFLRWAHNQMFPALTKDTGASAEVMFEAVRKYGVCEAKFMPVSDKAPSPEALRDAAKRTSLVARRVMLPLRSHINKPDWSGWGRIVPTLVDAELRRGHPIIESGTLGIPRDSSNPYILGEIAAQPSYGSSNGKNVPIPGSGRFGDGVKLNRKEGPHTRLIIGYRPVPNPWGGSTVSEHAENFMLECRESSGMAGDKGHYFVHVPEEDPEECVSLGLE